MASIARALTAWLSEQVHGDDLLRVRAGYHLPHFERRTRPVIERLLSILMAP